MLPNRVEETFDLPKVREMAQAVGMNKLRHFLGLELARLSELVNVGQNLNATQIDFIMESLLEDYPLETLADFKICFSNGVKGHYGDIFRLDSIVIGKWMAAYMADKYQRFETLPREKPFNLSDLPEDKLAEIKKAVADAPMLRPGIPMTDREIAKEGNLDNRPAPRGHYHPHGTQEALDLSELKAQYGREHTDLYTGKKLDGHPTFIDWIKTVKP